MGGWFRESPFKWRISFMPHVMQMRNKFHELRKNYLLTIMGINRPISGCRVF